MEHFLVVEVWAASLTAAGAVGWLIGEAHSAGRERLAGEARAHDDLMADGDLERVDCQDDVAQSFFTLSIPAAEIASVADDMRATPRATKTPRRRRTDFTPIAKPTPPPKSVSQSKTATETQRCADRLAHHMRRADQRSINVMEHYRRSIEELRCKTGVSSNPPPNNVPDIQPADKRKATYEMPPVPLRYGG